MSNFSAVYVLTRGLGRGELEGEASVLASLLPVALKASHGRYTAPYSLFEDTISREELWRFEANGFDPAAFVAHLYGRIQRLGLKLYDADTGWSASLLVMYADEEDDAFEVFDVFTSMGNELIECHVAMGENPRGELLEHPGIPQSLAGGDHADQA